MGFGESESTYNESMMGQGSEYRTCLVGQVFLNWLNVSLSQGKSGEESGKTAAKSMDGDWAWHI